MAKNCVYCKCLIDEGSVVDVCRVCGVGVWGEKMFGAIIQNMSWAREKGDLYQGSVSEDVKSEEKRVGLSSSIMQEGLEKKEESISAQELVAEPVIDIGIFKN